VTGGRASYFRDLIYGGNRSKILRQLFPKDWNAEGAMFPFLLFTFALENGILKKKTLGEEENIICRKISSKPLIPY